MIPSLSSNVLLVPFPSARDLAFSSCTHFSLRFTFAPIFQTKLLSSSKDDSFTVSYLINSCGLSPESAKLASKRVQMKDPTKADSVLDCLKNYGFSDADIKRVVGGFPQVIILNAEKNLKPKMEFFLSVGFKAEDLVTLISRNPRLLGSSLDKKIIPCYDFFKRVLVHDELVVKSFRRNTHVLTGSFGFRETNVVLNLELLKKLGVPESRIQYLLINAADFLSVDHAKFSKRVNDVIEIGLDPFKYPFVEAIRCWSSKSNWERKTQFFRSWGWSDSDISSAFMASPSIMGTSVEKLAGVLDLLVNKMGYDPSAVAAASYIFHISLKKNMIPKCLVIKVLMLKGLIPEDFPLTSFILANKKVFLERFVFKYLEKVPELLDIYQGSVDLSQLGYGFEEMLDTKLNCGSNWSKLWNAREQPPSSRPSNRPPKSPRIHRRPSLPPRSRRPPRPPRLRHPTHPRNSKRRSPTSRHRPCIRLNLGPNKRRPIRPHRQFPCHFRRKRSNPGRIRPIRPPSHNQSKIRGTFRRICYSRHHNRHNSYHRELLPTFPRPNPARNRANHGSDYRIPLSKWLPPYSQHLPLLHLLIKSVTNSVRLRAFHTSRRFSPRRTIWLPKFIRRDVRHGLFGVGKSGRGRNASYCGGNGMAVSRRGNSDDC